VARYMVHVSPHGALLTSWCTFDEVSRRPLHTMDFEGFVLRIFEGNVTKFAPHEALKLTLGGKLTSDDGLELHREAGSLLMTGSNSTVWHVTQSEVLKGANYPNSGSFPGKALIVCPNSGSFSVRALTVGLLPYSRDKSYPWSPFPLGWARPGPVPHMRANQLASLISKDRNNHPPV
jgi:hypothetical protein